MTLSNDIVAGLSNEIVAVTRLRQTWHGNCIDKPSLQSYTRPWYLCGRAVKAQRTHGPHGLHGLHGPRGLHGLHELLTDSGRIWTIAQRSRLRQQALGRLKRLKQKWKATIVPNPQNPVYTMWQFQHDLILPNKISGAVDQTLHTAPQRPALFSFFSTHPQLLARFSTHLVIFLMYLIYCVYGIYLILCLWYLSVLSNSHHT